MDVAWHIPEGARPLASDTGPRTHVWALGGLMLQIEVDVGRWTHPSPNSADGAWWVQVRNVSPPPVGTRGAAAMPVSADVRFLQDHEAKSHKT